MRKIEYKYYDSVEDCAWIIEQCLKGCEVSIGLAFKGADPLCKLFVVNFEGKDHIFPVSVARALTYIYVCAVDCKVHDKFHEAFYKVIHLFQSTMNYDNFDDELFSCCKEFISTFKVEPDLGVIAADILRKRFKSKKSKE